MRSQSIFHGDARRAHLERKQAKQAKRIERRDERKLTEAELEARRIRNERRFENS
jgi:hypothetical protein